MQSITLILSILFFARSSQQANTTACTKSVSLYSSDGKYLKHICEVKQEFLQSSAITYCNKHGMQLLTVPSKEVFEALAKHLESDSIFSSAPKVWNHQCGVRINGLRDPKGNWFSLAPEKSLVYGEIPFVESSQTKGPCMVIKREETFKVAAYRCHKRYPIICEFSETPEDKIEDPIAKEIKLLDAELGKMQSHSLIDLKKCEKMQQKCKDTFGEREIIKCESENVKIRELLQSLYNYLKINLKDEMHRKSIEIFDEKMKKIDLKSDNSPRLTCNPSENPSKCTVAKAVVTNQSAHFSSLQKGINSRKIRQLAITEQIFWFIPRKFASFFPQLEELTITDSRLKLIKSGDFFGFSSLTNLDLRNNELKELTDRPFEQLSNLTFLDLSHNKISEIDADIFGGLDSLKEIRLNNNVLTAVKSSFFETNAALETVWLQQNAIEQIDASFISFMEETSLGYVDLRDNKCIDSLYQNEAQYSIDMMRQKCAPTISLSCRFGGSYNCKSYNLYVHKKGVKIVHIIGEHARGRNADSVNQLIIKGQNVRFIPVGLERIFKSLVSIIVVESKLEQITRDDFNGLRNIKELIVTGNSLKYVDPDSFGSNQQLEKIDLSSNELDSLPTGVFTNLPNLKVLNLSGNNFKELRLDIIDCPSPLEFFDFSKNANAQAIHASIVNICLKNSKDIDFSGVGCIGEEVLVVEKADESKLDELFTLIDVNC